MEVTVIKGKRENSKYFFIQELNNIYSTKSNKNGEQFVRCYNYEKGCKARGKIDVSGKFYSSVDEYGLHSNHQYSTSSVINYLACCNEMKVEARTSGKMPNVIYDEGMSK